MNVPEGMNQDSNTCLLLKSNLWTCSKCKKILKKILSVVKSMRFTKNKSDPCLLSKCIDDHVVTIRIFVDDCLVVGKDELIQEVVQGL
jgi:hypothetical protein